MDLFDALGETIRSELSAKRHTIPRVLLYDDDAPALLASQLLDDTDGRRVVVLTDVRTREVAGTEVLTALAAAGWNASELIVTDPQGEGSTPACDDITKDALAAQLPAADVLVAVGSGVINDLTKWLAGESELPYAVFATAASMNGYAAANVAPAINGVKSLFRAKAPRIIATRPKVIEQAPFHLTASGLGDVIAKPVSTADWIVNHLLFDERFSLGVASVIDHVEPSYLDAPEALAARDGKAMRALFEALVLSGCAMTLQGSSMPASGGEHLISHTLDMTSHAHHLEHDLHGRQVGVATIFAAALYQKLMQLEAPSFSHTEVPFERQAWGHIAAAVEVEHEKKCRRVADACARLSEPGRWSTIKERLTPALRDPARIKRCLERSGAAHRLEDIGCSRERFLMAVHNCSAMRERFTSIDLARAAGLLPACAEELIDTWLS
jgi:glycerol-1-phosphate dehydrogenase [NAD(P)+]